VLLRLLEEDRPVSIEVAESVVVLLHGRHPLR
jgi:hypothetical protein